MDNFENIQNVVEFDCTPSLLMFYPKSENKYELVYTIIRTIYTFSEVTEEFNFRIEIYGNIVKNILINAMYDEVSYIDHYLNYKNDPCK